VLERVPGRAVGTASLRGEVLLGPASASVVACLRADGTLAGDAFISGKALAQAGLAIANALVRALGPRVQVVSIHDISDPSKVFRASSKRAVRASPFGLAIEASEALAVIVLLACSMATAVVLRLRMMDVLRTINSSCCHIMMRLDHNNSSRRTSHSPP
jgi:hypothetical protein